MAKPLEDLSIVMPVYNEAGSIERVLREIHAAVCARVPSVEFVVAEDGSTSELGLRLVTSRERKGYTRAVKDALALATRQWIFFSDADGQHDPRDLFHLAEAVEREGADLAVGVKSPRRDPWGRLLLSRGLRALNRLLVGARFRDANCGFRLMRAGLVRDILPQASLLPQFINTEVLLRSWASGYRIVEVEVRHLPRADGGSRGLPPARIPGEVLRLVRGLVSLRGELITGTRRGTVPS
jgi:glycosyltransferase involved in cell wall biosynthesis